VITVAYPALRLEPTETGTRFALYWMVRGWAHQKDGWMVPVARVSHLSGLPGAWRVVRATRDVTDVATLEEGLRGLPGVRVTRFHAGPGGDWTEEGR
jgi:hypothetical protein